MTCPLVRSMSQTCRHTPGLAPALCLDAFRDMTHSTASVGILSDRFLIAVRSLAIRPHIIFQPQERRPQTRTDD